MTSVGQVSDRYVGGPTRKTTPHARVRVLDLEVEIESLPGDISTSIQQHQIAQLGSQQKSRSLKAVSRIDLNAATA
jgi:hypothetical protein